MADPPPAGAQPLNDRRPFDPDTQLERAAVDQDGVAAQLFQDLGRSTYRSCSAQCVVLLYRESSVPHSGLAQTRPSP
jgi:hypothetical protein